MLGLYIIFRCVFVLLHAKALLIINIFIYLYVSLDFSDFRFSGGLGVGFSAL